MQHIRVLFVLIVLGLTSCGWLDNDDIERSSQLGVAPLESGLQTMTSGGEQRELFIQFPPDSGTASAGTGMSQVSAVGDGMSQVADHENNADRPLIFALHGYTGSYVNWVGEEREGGKFGQVYDLVDVIGDHVVFVAPQALEDPAGNTNWGGQADLDFFIDMLALFDRRGVEYNRNKIFVVGHSNGAGFTNEIACKLGDVFRAMVTAAGSKVSNDCIGSLAVLMFMGANDPLGSLDTSRATREYWVKYNGWDPDASVSAYEGLCDDFSFPDQPDNLPYPVVYCLHQQGHDYPDFGSEVGWEFLTSLSEEEPTPDSPPGGGAEVATPPSDTTLTFQVDVPLEAPRPVDFSASLRVTSFIDNPTCSRPDVILGGRRPIAGLMTPGEVSDPITIPITYTFFGEETYPADWALSITIYVEGGSVASIPAPGVDYNSLTPITLVSRNAPVVIPDVISLVPVVDLCDF